MCTLYMYMYKALIIQQKEIIAHNTMSVAFPHRLKA